MILFLGSIFLSFFFSFWISDIIVSGLNLYYQQIALFLNEVIQNHILRVIFVQGFLTGMYSILSFLPVIFIIFLLTAMISKMQIFNPIRQRFANKLVSYGLPADAMLPLLNGFGCTVPAYISTRIIKDKKERLLTMIAVSFIPCRAKMTMFIVFCDIFFSKFVSALVLMAIYIIGFGTGILVAKRSKKVSFIQNGEKGCKDCIVGGCSGKVHGIVFDTLRNVIGFARETCVTFCVISIIFATLANLPVVNEGDFMKTCQAEKTICEQQYKHLQIENSYLSSISKKISFLTKPIGFNWQLNAALIIGTSGKEAVISALNILYFDYKEGIGNGFNDQLPFKSAVSFIVFMIFYIPCVSAVTTMLEETTTRFTFSISCLMIGIAWIASFIVYNILSFFI